MKPFDDKDELLRHVKRSIAIFKRDLPATAAKSLSKELKSRGMENEVEIKNAKSSVIVGVENEEE